MGEAQPPEKEYVLALLPFKEDTALLESIRKRHPNVEFTYREVYYEKGKPLDTTIPDGKPRTLHSEFRPLLTIIDLIEDTTILVTLFKYPTPKQAKNLKFIHLFSAGADRLSETPIWEDTDVPFTNSSGVHGPQIAEWVILQILSASHKQKQLVEWQKKHIWGKSADIGTVRDGVGQRLGVLGYGAIGRQGIPSKFRNFKISY